MLVARGGARGLRGAASSSSRHGLHLSMMLRPLSVKAGGPGVPPPSDKSTAKIQPPLVEKKGGLGLGGALAMLAVGGAVAGSGYYYVFAGKEEKAAIDAKMVEVEKIAGEYLPLPKKTKEAVKPAAPAKESAIKPTPVQRAEPPSAPEARVPPEEPPSAVVASKKAEAEAEEAELVEEAVAELEEAKAAQQAAVVAAAEKEVAKPAPPAQPAAVAKKEQAPAKESMGKAATDSAAEQLSQYQERAKGIRLDTLNRASEEALAQGQALARHLEASLLKDLNQLDPDALKLRIVQLTGEMQERTKWEAFRLHETVRKAEEELSAKYTSLIDNLQKENLQELARQARAYEAEKELALRKLVEEKEAELRRRLAEETEAVEKLLLTKYQEQRSHDQQNLEARMRKELEDRAYQIHEKAKAEAAERIQELKDLKSEIQALDQVFVDDRGYEHQSYKVHRITAAIQAFEQKLATSDPLAKELEVLKKVTQGDEVVQAALASLPSSASSGVPTLSELQVRFPKVRASSREAAFVPESSPGMMGHIFGSVLAAVTIKPKGLVDGSGADETLARAAYHVERGDLSAGVKELETLQGLPARTVKDWVADARARLLVEQAIKVLNSRSALLNRSLI